MKIILSEDLKHKISIFLLLIYILLLPSIIGAIFVYFCHDYINNEYYNPYFFSWFFGILLLFIFLWIFDIFLYLIENITIEKSSFQNNKKDK